MTVPSPTLPADAAASAADEGALLRAFDDILAREEGALAGRDTAALLALAEERERLTVRLFAVADARRATGRGQDAAAEAELVALYQALRSRHETRARVVRRYADRNARALGVLSQAGRDATVYGADGRMTTHWAPGA